MNKIRVLVVDDSILYREIIKSCLEKDNSISVVAMAKDAYEAEKLIPQHKPDVITLDVEMPGMSGVEFLKSFLPRYPIPVVMVSSVSESAVDALHAGAVDFVAKKELAAAEQFSFELILKVKIASCAKVRRDSMIRGTPSQSKMIFHSRENGIELIVIGASTGGTEAIFSILSDLPCTTPGIVIVQHMPPVFTRMYAERLDRSLNLDVSEAKTGDVLRPGSVLIAPGGMHVTLVKKGSGYAVECNEGDKVNGHIPSVDVLFDSAAKIAGKGSIGVLLTGMGSDGAKGLLNMRKAGAYTIGQDEASSVVYGMPKAAFDLGAVEIQAPLDKIASVIQQAVSCIGNKNVVN